MTARGALTPVERLGAAVLIRDLAARVRALNSTVEREADARSFL
jgi:hypothetical protein